MSLFQTLRPFCIAVHGSSVRFVHLVQTAPPEEHGAVMRELLEAQRAALAALLGALEAHATAGEHHACLEYALAALLPMLSVRYEPHTGALQQLLIECRECAMRCTAVLLLRSAGVAPATLTELLWTLTGFVAAPVRALQSAAVACALALLRLALATALDLCELLVAPLEPRRRTAFLLSQLLAVGGDAHDRDASEQALECARTLLLAVSAFGASPPQRQFLAWCFPGVVSSATRVVLGDYRVGHRLRCGAVALLSDAATLLLRDADTADVRDAPPSLDSLRALAVVPHATTTSNDDDGGQSDNERNFVRLPTPRWFVETRANLCAMLVRMFAAIGTESGNWTDGVVATVPWQLRQSLVALAERLLVECRAALTDAAVEALLDCIVVSAHHEQPLVANAAVAAQQHVAAQCVDVASLAALQRSVHRQATAIPRFVQGAAVHDAALLSSLRLMHGYIALLPADANVLLLLRDSVAPFVTALMQLFEPDLHSAVLSEVRPAANVLRALELEPPVAAGALETYPRRRYRRIRDERVAAAALAVGRLLGERTAARGQLHALTELFVAQLREAHGSGAVLLAVAALEGAYAQSGAERARVRRAATMVLEAVIECARDGADVALLVVAPEAMAAVAHCDAALPFATAADRSDAIDAHVMRTLHTLLDLLAHEHAAVQQAARAALQRMAQLSGVGDVHALVRANADYVVDCTCRRLRHEPELEPSTARILLSVTRHVDTPASLSLLVDAIESVAARLVRCDTPAAGASLELLAEFAGALQRVAQTATAPLPPRLVRVTAPLAALLPRAIRSRAPAARVAALALTERLIGALRAAPAPPASDDGREAPTQSGAKLLPTVHDVWASLVPRLSDTELSVALAALHVLASIASAAGSFLRTRIADNVLPALQTSLLSFTAAARAPVQAYSSQHKRTALAAACLATVVAQCDLSPATLVGIGALARDVAHKYDWRELADVSARLKSLQTDASERAARAEKCSR